MAYKILKEDGYALLKEDGYALLLEAQRSQQLSATVAARTLSGAMLGRGLEAELPARTITVEVRQDE